MLAFSAVQIANAETVTGTLTVAALGDSLTAGYGLAPDAGLVPQLQAWLTAQGEDVVLINAGVSGDTTAGGLSRLEWTLTPQVQALIVTLGGNDMLRGLPPAQTRQNLDQLLGKLAARKISVVIMGMLAAPNWGADHAAAFNAIYPDLAKKHGATLVPFFLAAVIGKPQLIQGDRIHPTAGGIDEMVGATVEVVAGAVPAK